MKLSRYLKIYPLDHSPDRVILFSTRKASKIIISKETLKEIEEKRLSQEETELLKDLKIVVEDPEEEKREMGRHFHRINSMNRELDLTVALNLDCNFACVYCFEENVKAPLYMDEKTERRLIDFVKRELTEEKESLRICYYGGEPLLSLERLKSISSRLKQLAESRSKSYTGTMITNGHLLTKKVATELSSLGIKEVKVTLDGPPEIHNQRRPLKSGGNTFGTIIKNLKDCCDIIKVELGGNYDQETYRSFATLFNLLEKEGITPDRLRVVNFGPVMKNPECEPASPNYSNGLTTTTEPWVAEAEAHLRDEIIKRGYKTKKISPLSCLVDIDNAYAIDPNGLIYKCQNFLGKKGFEIGSLQSGPGDHSKIYSSEKWNNETCLNCAYLPLCFGGCRYMSYIKHATLESLDCQKEYFDNTLETLVKQEIDPNLLQP